MCCSKMQEEKFNSVTVLFQQSQCWRWKKGINVIWKNSVAKSNAAQHQHSNLGHELLPQQGQYSKCMEYIMVR